MTPKCIATTDDAWNSVKPTVLPDKNRKCSRGQAWNAHNMRGSEARGKPARH